MSKDKEEFWRITPKGIACLALVDAGLVDDIMDNRIDDFWDIFVEGMMMHGYMKEED